MNFVWDGDGKWYAIHDNKIPAVRGRFDSYKELFDYMYDRLPIASPIRTNEQE